MPTVRDVLDAISMRVAMGFTPSDRHGGRDRKRAAQRQACPDCHLPLARESDRTRCAEDCNGCKECHSVCWREYHFDTCPTRRKAK